jgi:hypothetical protein
VLAIEMAVLTNFSHLPGGGQHNTTRAGCIIYSSQLKFHPFESYSPRISQCYEPLALTDMWFVDVVFGEAVRN